MLMLINAFECIKSLIANLNTSNVNVNHIKLFLIIFIVRDLNTSNVNVNLKTFSIRV